MKDSRTEEVNRALEVRRALMNRRILFGRILLWAWVPLGLLNLVFCQANANFRIPLSSTTADFLLIIRFLYPQQKPTVLLVPLAILIPVGIAVAALLWKKHNFLRTGVFILIWSDIICMIAAWLWNPILLFGDNEVRNIIAVCNLAAHIFLVWHISRAKRAVESLEVLPEQEYEGDPFEEFRNKSKD